MLVFFFFFFLNKAKFILLVCVYEGAVVGGQVVCFEGLCI